MENEFEGNESLPKAEILTGQELFDLIYQGDVLPQDSRFLGHKQGGVFKYFNLQNLINIHKKKEDFIYPVIRIGSRIVAICELEKSPYEENLFWIKGVSVDPEHQGNHYASSVLEEVFKFAKDKGHSLLASQYSPEGFGKLKPVCHRLAEKYKVDFRENGGQ